MTFPRTVVLRKTKNAAVGFLSDYAKRHKHPVNALLHIFGVPLAFFGIYKLFSSNLKEKGLGLSCLVLGYWLQFIGHRSQGNEVGEILLVKKILKASGFKSRATNLNSMGNSFSGFSRAKPRRKHRHEHRHENCSS